MKNRPPGEDEDELFNDSAEVILIVNFNAFPFDTN